jgi:hypothetical protein
MPISSAPQYTKPYVPSIAIRQPSLFTLNTPDKDRDLRAGVNLKVQHRYGATRILGLAHGYPDIDGLRKFVRESEHRPAQRKVFKRLHLGTWLDGAAEPAFDLAVWDEGNEPFIIADLEGCKAWIGVDLSR